MGAGRTLECAEPGFLRLLRRRASSWRGHGASWKGCFLWAVKGALFGRQGLGNGPLGDDGRDHDGAISYLSPRLSGDAGGGIRGSDRTKGAWKLRGERDGDYS